MLYRIRHNPRYLAKGITVCPRWLDFMNFLKDMDQKPEGRLVSLHRIDNSKGYSPENCKWSDPKEQNNYKGNTVFITSTQFGTRPQQEWIAILLAHTGDMSWDVRKLKKALDIMTLDELLHLRKITSLSEQYADDPLAVNPSEFIPA